MLRLLFLFHERLDTIKLEMTSPIRRRSGFLIEIQFKPLTLLISNKTSAANKIDGFNIYDYNIFNCSLAKLKKKETAVIMRCL